MWLAPDGQAERGRARRRLYPVHMYVGKNGSGKSLTAIWDTLPTLESGRHVLSTVRLLDYENPRPCDDDSCTYVMHGAPNHMAAHPLYVPFTRWEQFLEFTDGDVIMDEVTGVADSNEAHSMPIVVRNKLAQLRRCEVAVRLTGLNWIRADKRIREAVVAVTACKSSMPERRKDDSGEVRLWRKRRLSVARTYDAQTLPLDDISATQFDKADMLVSSRLWIPGTVAIRAYDTFDPVLSVGTVTDSGRCISCGGSRRAPECSCADYREDRAARKAAGTEGAEPRSAAGSRTGRRPVALHVHEGHG